MILCTVYPSVSCDASDAISPPLLVGLFVNHTYEVTAWENSI